MFLDQLLTPADLRRSDKPRYQTIAEELAQAILIGQLAPGERLPTQRQLAQQLHVTTGTISRAYSTLERRGLATARVGDGTYVRTQEHGTEARGGDLASAPIDFAYNQAIPVGESKALQRALMELSSDEDTIHQLTRYQPEVGWRRHREAGATWLRRFGMSGDFNRVMITHGAQHALACVLRTLARPGDAVLTEPLCYPGMLGLARSMRLQLIAVECDDEGLVPSALERTARNFDAKLVFCTPTLQNPTTSTMSMVRREEIAATIRRRNLLLIEDCVAAAAVAAPLPALSALLPQHALLLSSFSKALAPGLRVGYLEAAPEWLGKFSATIRADSFMVTPLAHDIVTRWIDSGQCEQLLEQHRRMVAERQQCALPLLAGLEHRMAPDCPLIWLPLPEPWRAGQFSAAMRHSGVLVRTADHFAIGRAPAPHAIRISLNAERDVERIGRGLEIMRSLLQTPPSMPMES